MSRRSVLPFVAFAVIGCATVRPASAPVTISGPTTTLHIDNASRCPVIVRFQTGGVQQPTPELVRIAKGAMETRTIRHNLVTQPLRIIIEPVRCAETPYTLPAIQGLGAVVLRIESDRRQTSALIR